MEHVDADDVRRHQVGSELDAVELAADGQRQGPHQERLRRPRRPLQEHVPARQKRDHGLIQDGIQADDHLGKLATNRLGSPRHRFKVHGRVPPQHGEVSGQW